MFKLINNIYRNIVKSITCTCSIETLKLFKKLGISISCSGNARLIQSEKGGLIVNSIKVQQRKNHSSGHFLVLTSSNVLEDSAGIAYTQSTPIKVGQIFDFGDGEYVIVSIEDKWENFNIKNIIDLCNNIDHNHKLYTESKLMK